MATVLQRLDDALSTPVDALPLHDVRSQMQLVRAAQAVAAARLVDLHRRMADLASAPDQFVRVDPVSELRRHGGLRSREVRSVESQAVAVEAAPDLGRLWSAGVTSSAHVEVVGRALDSAGDGRGGVIDRMGEIVEAAATMRIDDFDRMMKAVVRDAQPDEGVELFERQRRLTHHRQWNGVDGMLHYAGCIDAERGAAFAGAIDRKVEAMFHSGDRDVPIEVAPGVDPNDHRRALALLALCSGAAVDGGAPADARPARAELVVHVDLQTLRDGLHAHSVCRTNRGADLPPTTARRIACDAEIIPMVLGSPGVPLDVGRSRRLATAHQRRALEGVHITCAMPDCTVAFGHCTIHHITPWEQGGVTDLANLVPLCSRHHHAVHEGGWTIRLDPDTRRVEWTPPGAPLAPVAEAVGGATDADTSAAGASAADASVAKVGNARAAGVSMKRGSDPP